MKLRESHRVEKRDGYKTRQLWGYCSSPQKITHIRTSFVSDTVHDIPANGQTRGAVEKVISKKGRSSTIKRPVQRFYPLEIRSKANPRRMTNQK
ncbi:Hypothetical predicted protein [Paramuricea clavata]|uniref:Uncharacterized protein n=1 Tax=Paramuricea clavata TaxID=317549 RepID=A0A6S7HH80_PARCT|nr:Hypothetical predicted protein [Paramuricea clavata]